MDFQTKKNQLLLSLLLCCFSSAIFSQKMTIVKGVIVDADTKEVLPLVNIAFLGTAIGTTSELDGTFVLESKWASDSIQVSYVGYETQVIGIQKGLKQEVTVSLSPVSLKLGTVEVTAKKGRYKRKDNPAVELMKNVIDHKGDNRIESQAFYEFNKYEKIQFDINNFDPEKLKKKRTMKKFQFIFDYIDTSDLNGKPFLPFFIQETVSKVYYRKAPESKKEYQEGVKVTGIQDYVDLQDFTTMLNVLYQNVNIYDDNVRMLDLTFMSPLSPLANTYYRFYLADTNSVVNGYKCTKVSFMPVNNQNIAFKGDLYILRDSSYAVIKADFGVTRQINVNFVQDLKLLQEFSQKDGTWIMTTDQLAIDFALLKKGTGVYGTRTVSYKDHVFGEKKEDSIYAGTENVIAAADAYKKTDTFWDSARHDSLTTKEKGIYQMIDTLQRVPAFKTAVNVMSLLFTGYKPVGPVDIGPVGAFYSFNPVEGFRLKVGGETNLKLHPKLMFAGYAAYGFGDEEWKYGGAFLYSFRENFKANPKHFFRIAYQHEVNLVGQQLQFSSADNFFLSFQRGTIDRMLFVDRYQADYFLELDNNLSWNFNYTNTSQRPIGSFKLDYRDPVTQEWASLPEIRTNELGMQFRFAPNEQYLQGRSYRIPVFNRYPVFTFNFAVGLKNEGLGEGFLGGDFEYKKASLNIFKRFYLSLLGTMRLEVEGGKIWGDGIPYFLLHLPRANQSFAYRSGSFNMMNYLEFASDEYLTWNMEHAFNGFFFNKIPLLRKAKLREVITVKGIYGRLTARNNPNNHPEYVQFLYNDENRPVTYTLEDKPYLEASVGVANIFKFARIDAVRRLTYLNHPNVPSMFGVKGLGLRMKIKFEF
jgi:hypothetical protein